MERKYSDEAVNCFKSGYNCSQAVCSTFAERFNLDKNTALKISGAFGGGIARTANVCGAVTGALMIIGLKYQGTQPNDDEAKRKTYEVAQEFMEKIKSKHGSIICRDLCGCDITTPEGKQYFDDHKIKENVCCHVVGDAAEFLENIL